MPVNPDRITGADVDLADGIVLSIVNNGGESERWINQLATVRRNLIKKAKAGKYDAVLAGRLWRYTVEFYLPTYKREEGDTGRVDVPTRNLAGRFLEENQRQQVFQDAGITEPTFTTDAELRAIEGNDTGTLAPSLGVVSVDLAPTLGGK